MRSAALLLAFLALSPLAMPLAPAPVAAAEPSTQGHPYSLQPITLTVQGQPATGWLAYPTDTQPTTLLVYAHGCCGKAGNSLPAGWARDFGAVIIGMDYRGPGGWDVWAGHQDTVAAAEYAKARFPSITRTILWGISMGGEVSGLAAAARPDLFDYWVSSLGVMDLYQQFAVGAFQGVILQETGGLPGQVSVDEWNKRSPDLHALEMKGLKHAYLNHGAGDMVVYPTNPLTMFAGLQAAGVPSTLCLGGSRAGGLVLPYAPFVGFPVVPTPLGLSGHDGPGFACTFGQLFTLLTGGVPDAGTSVSIYVTDSTTRLTEGAGLPIPR